MALSHKHRERPAEGPENRVVALSGAKRSDAELAQAVAEGRDAAVAELFDRYGGLVRGVLIRTLGSRRDVDDLTQDTFIVVIRRCHTLRNADKLRSFVVSVAIRTAKNELRRRAVRRWVGLDDEELPVTAPQDSQIREGVRHLYQALDRLDARSRVLFVLRHVEGLELADLAEADRCSLATVKRRLARAEKRFDAIARNDPVLRQFLGTEK